MISIESQKELLSFFVIANKGFYAYWKDNYNYSTPDDGIITYAGVCNDYAHYLIDNLQDMPIEKIEPEVKKNNN